MVRSKSYDVIVAGGGAAGFSAAVGAKRAGASCLLIERNGSLGGQATNANVASYCGFFTHGNAPEQIVFGVGGEILQELNQLGFYDGYQLSSVNNAIVTLEIEAAKAAFDRVAKKHSLEFLLHCRMVDAVLDAAGEKIVKILCSDDEGIREFYAEQFVDATGDANLGHMAGAPYRFGDGQGGCQMSSRVMRIDHVDSSVKFRPADLEKVFQQAKADGFENLTKESGIVFRINNDTAEAILPSIEVPSLDAETLTACEIATRKQCISYIAAFRKYMPGMENCRLVWTGSDLGLRDTRHLVCEYTLTGLDVLNAVKQPDGIACGGWPCELHTDKNKMAQYIFIKDDDYYEIPLGCLKTQKIKNLWAAGRTISADPTAFASVRVMGTGFATGHAAGIAAAYTARDGKTVISAIQKELCRQNAKI